MQTVALDFMGRRVPAHLALGSVNYICEECGQLVRRRLGEHTRAHFFHLGASSCRQSTKSMLHIQMQQKLSSELGAVEEKIFPEISRIADVFWEERRLVVEVQCSFITALEVQERNRDYASQGYCVVWVLFDRRFLNSRWTAAEAHLSQSPHYYFNRKLQIYDCFSLDIKGRRSPVFRSGPLNLSKLKLIENGIKRRGCTFFYKRLVLWRMHCDGDLLDSYILGSPCYGELLAFRQQKKILVKNEIKKTLWERCIFPLGKLIYLYLLDQSTI